MYANWRSSCGRMGEGVRGFDEEELVRDWTSYTASIGKSGGKSKPHGLSRRGKEGERGGR